MSFLCTHCEGECEVFFGSRLVQDAMVRNLQIVVDYTDVAHRQFP